MNRSRCVLVWLAISVGSAAVASWALAAVPADPRTADVDDLLVGVAGLALAACAAWAWVVGTVVVAQALRHAARPLRSTPGVPIWAVRIVAAACGVAVLGAGVAHAETGSRTPGTSVSPLHDRLGDLATATAQTAKADQADQAARADEADESLDGLPFPDRAVGADRSAPEAASASGRGAGAGVREDLIVVQPGDSLWRLSAQRLGPAASAAEIAAATAALHERNRDVVGPDPDLIHPGDRLRPPTT